MKTNKYKPEADFEKQEFLKLIDELRKVDDEKLSDQFDERFYKNLKYCTPQKTFRQKLKSIPASIMLFFQLPHIRTNLILAATMVAIFTMSYIGFIYLSKPKLSEFYAKKNQPDKTIQNILSDSTVNYLVKKDMNDSTTLKVQDITHDKKYWTKLTIDINKNMDYGFLQEVKVDTIKSIVNSTQFIDLIKQTGKEKQISRTDTIKIVLQLLKE